MVLKLKQWKNPFEREHVAINLEGVKTHVDFKVIEILDDKYLYPRLLGIKMGI